MRSLGQVPRGEGARHGDSRPHVHTLAPWPRSSPTPFLPDEYSLRINDYPKKYFSDLEQKWFWAYGLAIGSLEPTGRISTSRRQVYTEGIAQNRDVQILDLWRPIANARKKSLSGNISRPGNLGLALRCSLPPRWRHTVPKPIF